MKNTHKLNAHDEAITFDQEGNLVINKEANISKKLMARRAIEALSERKELEQDLEHYYFE